MSKLDNRATEPSDEVLAYMKMDRETYWRISDDFDSANVANETQRLEDLRDQAIKTLIAAETKLARLKGHQ